MCRAPMKLNVHASSIRLSFRENQDIRHVCLEGRL